MRFAVNIPLFGELSNPSVVADLAKTADSAGWDGFFVWDHILGWEGNVVGDPWVSLAAAATATTRITLGPMVTPLPRRRPWQVARQAVSLQQLSGGRLILGVGIGFPPETEFGAFGEPEDAAIRAEMLDESLEILRGMWSGEAFGFDGRHYRMASHTFLPAPDGPIPIWVAGMWPHRRPFRRAARFDGVAPLVLHDGVPGSVDPDTLRDILSYVGEHRRVEAPFDVAVPFAPGPDVDSEQRRIKALAEAGATWLQFGPHPEGESLSDTKAWVTVGPPRAG